MSYRRSFSKRIAVSYSGYVNYPASQSGGSVSYSGVAYEDVQVHIDVETTPFDASIAYCNKTVNALTGAVVATEAAQVAAIDNNAKKIGHTIVSGFFKTIRSEISQQIMELSTRIDATLVHLNEIGKRCLAKKKQMEADYNMILSRYLKTFSDLDHELSNRIHELDKPAFMLRQQIDTHSQRLFGSDMVSTIAVSGMENLDMQARISTSVLKKRAWDMIEQANTFLLKQRRAERTINRSLLKENVSGSHYVPVCFAETCNENGQTDTSLYWSGFFKDISDKNIISDFKARNWHDLPHGNRDQIGRYFNQEINRRYPNADAHSERIKENIVNLFKLNQTKSL